MGPQTKFFRDMGDFDAAGKWINRAVIPWFAQTLRNSIADSDGYVTVQGQAINGHACAVIGPRQCHSGQGHAVAYGSA